MPKKPKPLKTKLVSALRLVWLRSSERSAALKRDGYTCQCCGVKQSKAKGREVAVCVHHEKPIPWDDMMEALLPLLPDLDELRTMCVECHKKEHKKGGD